MKKRLVYSLLLLFLFFSVGSGITVYHTYRVTNNLESVISLHKVEIIRKDLVINLQSVQGNLYTAGTVFGKELDEVVENVTAMDNSIRSCNGCHHSREMTEKLSVISDMIEQYKESISYLVTTSANPERVDRLKMVAVGIGDSLLSRTQEMAFVADKNLTNKTMSSIKDINKSRFILLMTLMVTFLSGVVIAVKLTEQTTKPVYELVKAVRAITSGDLDYKITYHDSTELGELADSFNMMALTLRENINRIEDNERRYRTLFENAGEAIFILETEGDRAGKIFSANYAAAEMHGYTVNELLSMNITDLDSPEAVMKAQERISMILSGKWINFDVLHIKKDGTVFPVEVTAGPLEISGSTYILAFDRDISERRQAEEKFQRTEQMRTYGELAAGIAHEIKNPLAGIRASMQVLSEEPVNEDERKTILSRVIDEVKRIESSLNELLHYAKPAKPQFISLDVNNILGKTAKFSLIESSKTADDSRSISISLDFDSKLPLIMADPMQLQQIFLNLVLNAKDAMPEGGTLYIKTRFNPALNSVTVDISDTGKGIDKEVINNIFKPFFTTKAKGTGLGLPITKRLIEEHGGNISVESPPGKGTTFRISLPVLHEEENS